MLQSTYNWKIAFWFAPTVTQINTETKFNMFNLSTAVYAWIEKIWTDSHNDYKDFESRYVDLSKGAEARKALWLRESL